MAGRQLLTKVSKHPELRSVHVAISECLKGTARAMVFTFISSMLLGPVGFAVGGTLGGFYATTMAKTYKSIPEILNELTEQQQDELVASIYEAVRAIPIYELVADFAINNMFQDPVVAGIVVATVKSYLNSLPGMKIQN